MKKHTMPVLSEQEREAQISLAEEELAHLNCCCVRYSNGEMGAGFVEKIERQIINQQIALAALTAKPVGFTVETDNGNTLFRKRKPRMRVSNYPAVAVYIAPPVPVKQEGEQ